ncbi:MAG: hypothetical protein ACO2ER_15780, partial [Castellaniella sp.]
ALSGLIAPLSGRLPPSEARRRWFREALPLTEILALSFAFEACQQLAQPPHAPDWVALFDAPRASPLIRWLGARLRGEGLLVPEGTGWTLARDAGWPQAADVWQNLLRDHPAYLPQLTLMGHWGRQLPALLRGELDPLSLHDRLRHSAVAESRYQDDPTYLGVRLALESLLRSLAGTLPAARRLRVLEWAAAPSELFKTLLDVLPEDQVDYVLVVTDPELADRQSAECQDQPAVRVLRTGEDEQALWESLG